MGSTPCTPEPVADAGPDQEVFASEIVTLDGSGSTGEDLYFCWRQTGGPDVGLPECMQEPSESHAVTFTAPAFPATLTFELCVQNVCGYYSCNSVTVVIQEPEWSDPFPNDDGFPEWDSIYGDPSIVHDDFHSGPSAAELKGDSSWDAIAKYFPADTRNVTVGAWVKVTEWSESSADILFTFINDASGEPTEWFEGIGGFSMYSQEGGYYWGKDGEKKAFSHNLPFESMESAQNSL